MHRGPDGDVLRTIRDKANYQSFGLAWSEVRGQGHNKNSPLDYTADRRTSRANRAIGKFLEDEAYRSRTWDSPHLPRESR